MSARSVAQRFANCSVSIVRFKRIISLPQFGPYLKINNYY
jgi:hypothetical protein